MAWLINCSITTECRSSGMCVLNRSWGLVLWGTGGGGALILLLTFTPIFPGSGNLLSPGPNTPRFLERLSTISWYWCFKGQIKLTWLNVNNNQQIWNIRLKNSASMVYNVLFNCFFNPSSNFKINSYGKIFTARWQLTSL